MFVRTIKEPIKVNLNSKYVNGKREQIRYSTYMANITDLNFKTTFAPTIKE